jgi:hypothetical protein
MYVHVKESALLRIFANAMQHTLEINVIFQFATDLLQIINLHVQIHQGERVAHQIFALAMLDSQDQTVNRIFVLILLPTHLMFVLDTEIVPIQTIVGVNLVSMDHNVKIPPCMIL